MTQRGARHRYQIPRMLEEAGLLAALYTDSTVYSPVGRMAGVLCKIGLGVHKLKALALRVPEGIPADKIFSSDRELLHRGKLSTVFEKRGLRGASVVYNMNGEDIPFLKYARAHGAKIIVDVFISPKANQNLYAEQQRFKGAGEKGGLSEADCRRAEHRGIGAYAPLADILLCPSEWVADGVRDFAPDHAHKIRVVPYGSSIEPKRQVDVEPGRLLFAGRDALRKGLPYLAEAVAQLKSSGLSLQARVAGLTRKECDWMPYADHLEFLGIVPMDKMSQEYERADLFVLPSLAEGQAGVILEALSHGCPVAATRESGVDLITNENGMLVESRSAAQLADAIKTMVVDRGFRDRIGAQGRYFFEREFAPKVWRSRLVEVVEKL
ncbi:glycosyltransferase family 4 protein [Pontiella agarivorans]|uniref:glycosyltransferase family 4 protein n=1 Tax=Pontiella agarivorans TaxID=3038953 RepID=UPI002AD307FA|nr:glycosyltransferase family 4 protein [Pontiella agarivorans]